MSDANEAKSGCDAGAQAPGDRALLGDVIRDAVAADVPALVALARRAAMEARHLTIEQKMVWAERLTEATLLPLMDATTLRVMGDGAPVGFGCRIADQIEMLYVDPRAQGQGLGKKLLRDLERSAHAGGIHALRLVTADNAVGFYRSRGWTVDRVADEDIDGVTLTRTYMVKA